MNRHALGDGGVFDFIVLQQTQQHLVFMASGFRDKITNLLVEIMFVSFEMHFSFIDIRSWTLESISKTKNPTVVSLHLPAAVMMVENRTKYLHSQAQRCSETAAPT